MADEMPETAQLTDREIRAIEHAQTISSPERLSVAQRRAIEHVIAERMASTDGGEHR